jgi:hypothetical protein
MILSLSSSGTVVFCIETACDRYEAAAVWCGYSATRRSRAPLTGELILVNNVFFDRKKLLKPELRGPNGKEWLGSWI